MLSKRHLNILNGCTNSALKYGIIFYPCFKNNKLFFVAKGYQGTATGSINTFETKFFYDNMDVCPKHCPELEIN